MRRARSPRIVGAAAVSFVVLTAPGEADAWCRTTTSDARPVNPTDCVTEGTPLAWRNRCGTFSLDTRAGGGLTLPQVRTAVSASFAAWNAVDCGNGPILDYREGGTVVCDQAEYSSSNGNANIVAFENDFAARMYPTDAIAITVVWHDTRSGQIYDADILVNEAMGPFVNCPDAGCPMSTNSFDLRNVITHEAGHFFGLSHSADSTATMFFRADPAETAKRSLASDDLAGICVAYGDDTVPAECDPTPRHGFDADCMGETPGGSSDDGCGCSVPGGRSTPSVLGASILGLGLAWLSRRRARRSTRGS